MRKKDMTNPIYGKIMLFLKDFWVQRKRSPTLREIQESLDISSASVVLYYMRNLEEAGEIELRPDRKARTFIPKGLVVSFKDWKRG
jgi:SOS-response transcriptional repressor LexA